MKKNYLLVLTCLVTIFFYNCSKEEDQFTYEATDEGVYLKGEIFDNYTFNVKNLNSGKYMDVEGGSTSNGANVLQWSGNGGQNQKWKFEPAGSGYYYLRAMHSGKYLDVSGGSTSDGGNVIQWTKNNGYNQQWKPIRSNGYWKL